jgi:hemoglobin/transferrin/lactoferrin receptor protein
LLGVTFGRFGPSFFPAQRVSANRFIEEVYGGDLIFRNDFATPNASHRLTYGVDLSTTFNSRPRQRVQTNLTTGASTTNAIPDDFPLKDFPDTNTLRLGLYIQDEVEFGHDRWALIPGIRFDHYDLNAQSDQDFERNGAEAADFSGSSLSPSLGVLYRLTDQVNLFGRYSRGFRAPLYSEINNGFSNQIFGYTTLPNPDLEAETSNSFELGVRGETRRFDFSLVGFYNNYDNFIDFQQVGTTPVNGRSFLLFQTRNVDEARTYGLEAKGEYQFSTGPGGFSLLGSLGWTVGDDLTSDEPLASVDPFEAVLGLRYQDPNDRWGTELLTTVVGQARGNSLDGNQGFVPDPYAVVDLLGYVNVTSDLSLNVGVYNLFNTEYFRYQDVRFLDTEEAFFNQRRDRRARPGTNFRIGVTMRL